jgi:AbiV family abortive infection protein
MAAVTALTPQEIAAGLAECVESAHDLYESGVVLHYQGRTTKARALLILAVEEYGKIGWLYRALLLDPKADAEWREWWGRHGFRDHQLKAELGRMMLTSSGLLPGLAVLFRDRFPFFAVSPQALDIHKQAMLYVNFDHHTRRWLSPKGYLDTYGVDNGPLIEDVEQAIRFVARNKKAGTFDPRVVAAFRQLNALASDEPGRFALLALFYATILRAPTGQAQETPLEQVIAECRQRFGGAADRLVDDWNKLGAAFQAGA